MASFTVGPTATSVNLGDDGGVVVNYGPATVSFSDSQDVRESPEGTIAAGASATLTGAQWLYATSRADVSVPNALDSEARLDALSLGREVPAAVVARKFYSGRVTGYNVTARTTRRLRTAVARQDPNSAGPGVTGAALRIMTVGDSNTNGSAASAPLYAQSYSGQLGSMLGRAFVDAGIGATADPGASDSRLVYAGAGWAYGGVGFGLFGNGRRATGTGNTATYGPVACTAFVLWYRKGPAEGTWSYSIDGAAAVNVNANAATESIASVTTATLAAGTHTIVITAPASGDISLVALEAANVGVGGARVIRVGSSGNSTNGLSVGNALSGHVAAVTAMAPDLVIEMLGTNDFGTVNPPITPAVYKSQTAAFVQALLAAGIDVAVIVEPAPQAPRTGQTTYTLVQYRQALYEVADENDIALIDMQDRWGDWVSANALGLMGDDYHPSNRGHNDTARAIYEALFGPWSSSTAGTDANALHLTGDETAVGQKTFRPAASNTSAVELRGQTGQTADIVIVRDPANANNVTMSVSADGKIARFGLSSSAVRVGDFNAIVAEGQVTPYLAGSGTGLLYISVPTLSLRTVSKVTNDNNTWFESSAVGIKTMTVRAIAGQTADLFVAADSGGTALSAIRPTGAFKHLATTTGGRPSASASGAGTQVYDTTLSKPIWSDGTVWRDAAGTAV